MSQVIRRVVVHHSATPDSGTASWGAIRNYHTKVNGWSDIGYHFGIERIDDAAGRKHVEILFGRPTSRIGAHVAGYNAGSLGVCVIGNFSVKPPEPDVWHKTLDLLQWICETYKVPLNKVYGHRELVSKGTECPGKYFDMDQFYKDLASRGVL